MTYSEIAYEVDGGILTITLDRPDHLNAFTLTMANEFCDALDRSDGDDDVRAVIVTGRGRAFCAGADLSSGASTFDYDARSDGAVAAGHQRDGGGVVALRIFESTKPVIAAINGPAVGVGITMTLPMDIRLASEDARMGFVFTRRGIVPEACSTWFLPRLVGIQQAVDWVYSGRVFPAAEAHTAGLVHRLAAPGSLLDTARALAAEFAENTSAISVALARRMLWQMLTVDHPVHAHMTETRAMLAMGRSGDAREGVTAFLERRPAEFTMRVSRDLPHIGLP